MTLTSFFPDTFFMFCSWVMRWMSVGFSFHFVVVRLDLDLMKLGEIKETKRKKFR